MNTFWGGVTGNQWVFNLFFFNSAVPHNSGFLLAYRTNLHRKEEGVRGKVNLSALVTVVDFHLALAISERCSGTGREILLHRNEA